jgi:hypothetical protein
VAVRNFGGADVAEFASAGFILCKRELLCWRDAGGIIIRYSAGGTSTWADLREDGCVEIGGTSGVGGVGMLFRIVSRRDGGSDELVAKDACMGSILSPRSSVSFCIRTLTIDNLQRLYSTMGGSLLILSLLLSPQLRHLLSHRYLVFLGGISYALYLLHATLMRSALGYIIYTIPRRTERKVVVVNHKGEQLRIDTVITEVWRGWGIVRSFLFGAWMVGLLGLAHLWRRRIDTFSLVVAKRLEEVVSGKRGIANGFGGIGMRLKGTMRTRTGESTEKADDVELGALEKEGKD